MPYFAPRQPEYNNLHHLLFQPWVHREPMSVEDLRYHAGAIGPDGKARHWFFDSFIACPPKAPSGNYLINDINLGRSMSGEGDFFAIPAPNPGTYDDWCASLDMQLGPEGMFDRLDRAIDQLATELGPPPFRRNAIITIPYPHPHQCMFREDPDRMNFSVVGQNLTRASEQRLAACKWFVDAAIERWKLFNPRNLHLLGFYWVYESLHYAWQVDDHWVLKELYKHIRSRGLRVFWIPFYSSFNVNLLATGRGFYFDCACLQPNHMFYTAIDNVDQAAQEAKDRGAGVEMEYYMHENETMRTMGDRHRRFRNYCEGGVRHGYMKDSVCAYFCGYNDLRRMATTAGDAERRVYDDHCRFVAGTYTIGE